MSKRNTSLFLSVFFASMTAWGWGAVGHRATGHIADAFLTPQARAGIARYLGRDTLADATVWADEIRSDDRFKHAAAYHFEGVPDGVDYITYLQGRTRQQIQTGSLMPGIARAYQVLADARSSEAQKSDAFKFLIHFIGDLHQPLHSGRESDKGGNTIKVNWFGRDSNLHSVWDTGLILTGHSDLFQNQPQNADYGLLYARFLINRYRGVGLRPNTGLTETWLNESIQARARVYDRRAQADQASYQRDSLPVIDSRAYEAGLRIAETLNRVFANGPMNSGDVLLFQKIERITGPLNAIIFLQRR